MRLIPSGALSSFVILCLIWGSTWIAIKAGVDAVPPMLFAGSRFTVAGLLLLLFAIFRREPITFAPSRIPRLAVVSLLMITLCYGPLFWGMQHVNSGTAAVLELSLTPVALMCFALLLGEEDWRASRMLAIALGVCGIVLLYGPDAFQPADGATIASERNWGMIAIAASAFTYGLGSVLAKPLLREYPPFFVAGATTFAGGIFLLCYSIAFEAGAGAALAGRWGVAAWAGWAFLVLFGSLVGYTIFMRLLKDIGPSRSGSYAFVSPVIAVLLGVAFMGETVALLDIAGMCLMMAAAYLALRKEKEPRPGHVEARDVLES